MKKLTAVVFTLGLSLGIMTACIPQEGNAGKGEKTISAAETEDAGKEEDGAAGDAEADTLVNGDMTGDEISGENGKDIAVNPGNWGAYDTLIDQAKEEKDAAKREALLHEAEDMLMETGAVLPLFCEKDSYLQKEALTGVYSNPYGMKYFMFAEMPDKTLTVSLGAEPYSLDPALTSGGAEASILVNIFSGLTVFDSEGKIQPDLASDYEVSRDGLTYTFYLKPDLQWSDGEPLTAQDFVYAWNRAANQKTNPVNAMLLDVIAENQDGTLRVAAEEDGAVLQVMLKAPCPYFPELCALPAYYPVQQGQVEAYAEQGSSMDAWCREAGFVTSGAYTVEEWNHEQSIILAKNPYYHRADEVTENIVEIVLSEDAEAALTSYSRGEVDFMDEIPESELRMLTESPEFHAADGFSVYYLSFNVTSEVFAGKTPAQANSMRRAFALLADRDYLCEYIVRAGQQPANSLMPADMEDGRGGVFRENDSEYTYPDAENAGYFNPYWSEENIAEAISLLTFAGYQFEEGVLSEETPLAFTCLIDGNRGSRAVAEALQQDFAAVGIEMQIKALEGNAFSNAKKYGRYDAVMGQNEPHFNDPVSLLEQWTTESSGNECFFGNSSTFHGVK